MNLSAIFSKTGKGVQEASGKTSHLSRADRAVLSAIDGKTPLTEVQKKFEKLAAPKFEALIEQLDKDGFIREVSSGASQPAAPVGRTPPASRAAPPKAPPADSTEDSGLDFTQAIKVPPKGSAGAAPKAPPVDLAAASRAEAERKAKEQEAFDYKARQEAETRAQAEAKARAAAESRARVEAEAKARAEAEAKTHAEADAKVKAAREAAIRMATEAKAKAGAADRERQAAEERARKEAEDKARLEAELNAKLAEERKAREDAERRASEAAERARRELEEKARRDAEELRQRLEAEMKAKLEEERKAREAEDRKRREEEERKRREEDERRRKEDEARRAKEEAERKAREAEDRKRREEEDRKRREEDERRRKADEERRAKEEAERRARREEEERRAKEEAERRKREEEARRAKEEGERRAREEQDRKRREEEDERREKEEAEAKSRAAQSQPAAAPPAAGGDIGDSLLADLESFSQREEEESRTKEEAARKAKEEAARRAREEDERQANEEAERKRREEEERRRKEDEERRAREEAERQAREEEEHAKQEEADRKRKAKESLAAKQAGDEAAAKGASRAGAAGDDDIEVTDEDLDMDDVKQDRKVLAKAAKKPGVEQGQPSAAAAAKPVRRPLKWGKPAAIALFVLLVGGVGLLNVMPVSTSDYEKAASEAMGVPVKIGSARLAVLAGVEVRFENVSIGDGVKIRLVRGSPEVGSLFGGKKAFGRMELEGASISQDQLAGALLGKVAGENFRVERIVLKQAKFDGPLALPALDVEAEIAGDGAVKSVTARGGDKLVVQLSPMGGEIGFEISAGSLAMPFVPALTLADFGWKGTANRGGVAKSTFDGRVYDGVVSGTARVRWGGSWTVEGEVKARGLKVAVFAPALVSEGKIEGEGSYAMSGSVPASLYESAKAHGSFRIEKGVLGSFNLTRALQTGGAQSTGRTEFSELVGQAVYDKGAIQIRNASLSAGAMNAGVSLDIDAGGGLAGRVAADVKTPTQTLRATLSVSGKITDPVVRK